MKTPIAANTAIIGAYHIFLALSNTGFLPRVIALRGDRFNSPHIAIAVATGVPIANVLFAGSIVGPMILPLMLFHQIQLMVCAFLAQRWAALRTFARQPSARRQTSF